MENKLEHNHDPPADTRCDLAMLWDGEDQRPLSRCFIVAAIQRQAYKVPITGTLIPL